MQVEKLRQFRKKSQGEDAVHGVADTAGVRRLHFIYTRALRKFKGDLRLWHAYLSFCACPHRRRLCVIGPHAPYVHRETLPLPSTPCAVFSRGESGAGNLHAGKSSGATKRLDRALTQALQLHSGTPALWVYAASWEVQKRQDMDAARALLSRGLRSCPESTKLWHEYFRLELVYALRLRERRDALGLAGGVMQHEALLTDDPAKALLLAGGVARVVHKQALAALPQAPVAFHTGFLDVLASLPVPFADVEVRSPALSTTLPATSVYPHLPLNPICPPL
jgi:U3 small nucleolar RNA-associated protein 6